MRECQWISWLSGKCDLLTFAAMMSGEWEMAFRPKIIEAKLALRAIHPEEFPSVAIEALESGIDGPITRRIAGLMYPSGWETDQLVEGFMAEAGLNRISRHAASARLAQDLAREIFDRHLDPLRFTRAFERRWIAADYSSSIQDLGTMDDEVYLFGTNGQGAREMVRQRLEVFAEMPNLP
jgi:hypothetical protein